MLHVGVIHHKCLDFYREPLEHREEVCLSHHVVQAQCFLFIYAFKLAMFERCYTMYLTLIKVTCFRREMYVDIYLMDKNLL